MGPIDTTEGTAAVTIQLAFSRQSADTSATVLETLTQSRRRNAPVRLAAHGHRHQPDILLA
jgi:hypothetical protein